ncbi:YidH family protein [Acidithiobacillus marinus]|nr:DUF202 domain-containing protein [Acidithiobacillus marinus]
MERTYLAYLKFLFIAFGTGIISEKMTLLLAALHFYELVPFFQDLYRLLTWPVLVLLFMIFYFFVRDLRYINRGSPVTSKEIQDPRIYFSAERTFLSWIRTGISIVIFGFIMEKFDFFLTKLALMMHRIITLKASFSGMDEIFLALGIISIAVGLVGFLLTVHQVDQGAYYPHHKLYGIYGLILLVCLSLLSYFLV